jgi:hypothetical protein
MNNNQKVFDILPPGKKENPQFKKEEKISFSGKTKEPVRQHVPQTEKRNSVLKKIFFFLIFLFIAFVLLSNFVLNRTEVRIWPETSVPEFSEEITVSVNQKAIDLKAGVIPGKLYEEEGSFVQEFSPTGKASNGQKATGVIRVYNNYSDAAQVLVQNTRFISDGGILFRTTERIVVPGGTYQGGKLQAGYADVNVMADEPGEKYNIGPSTFSIPGFLGTAKYTSFYGKSLEGMTGGSSEQVPQVLKEDLNDAKDDLIKSALEKGEKSLKNKIPEGYLLADDSLSYEVLSATSSAKVGDSVERFTYNIGIKVRAIVFSEADLKSFAESFIISKFSDGRKIQKESLDIKYKFDFMGADSVEMKIDADLSAKVYYDIDEEKLISDLAGKSFGEAEQIMSEQPKIIKAQIKSWPFWSSNISKDENKVKVSLMLD